MKSYVSMGMLFLCALTVRLGLLPFIDYPGINDPNHYYNLGLRLLDGHGFTMDYLWHFYNQPPDLVHPFDFWQPMAGILSAGGMWLFGKGVAQALIPFIVLGSLLPIVTYVIAKDLGISEIGSIFVGIGTALMPELVMNSLRTDTLIPNALFLCLGFWLFARAMQTANWRVFILSGIFAGLGYLTRGDNLLLFHMLIVALIAYAIFGRKSFVAPRSWLYVWIAPIVTLLVMSPWVVRNFNELGQWSSVPEFSQTFFYTDFRDHYHVDEEYSLETLLEAQTPTQIVMKRIFEGAASIRMMITTLDIVFPLFVIGGLLLLVFNFKEEKEKILFLLPPTILLGGMAFAYIVLMPLANQGGSYKKSYLTLVPFFIVLAGYALDKAIERDWLKRGIVALTTLLMFQSSVMFVVEDIRFTAQYLTFLGEVDTQLEQLPDTNGDGEIIVMAQDPFALRYMGYRGVQIPFSSREVILDIAERYNVDYLLFPPARPALDPIYDGEAADPRFIFVTDVNQRSQLYRFDFEVSADDAP